MVRILVYFEAKLHSELCTYMSSFSTVVNDVKEFATALEDFIELVNEGENSNSIKKYIFCILHGLSS